MNKFLSFDGVQGYVVASGYKGIAYPFDQSVDRSITFWLRTTHSGNDATICYWGANLTEDLGDGEENRIRLIQGHLELFSRTSGRRTASLLNDGNWHHVAFVYNTSDPYSRLRNFANAIVYVDGILDNGRVFENGIAGINTPGEQDLMIGARPARTGGVADLFPGDLDEFAVYRTAITLPTVTGSYNNGIRGADLSSVGEFQNLHLWYRMGDEVGDTVPSGMLYTGTLIDRSYYGRHGITFSGTSIGE